jgi:hypothetical protein
MMMFVTTLFNYVRDDLDAKVVMECVIEASSFKGPNIIGVSFRPPEDGN